MLSLKPTPRPSIPSTPAVCKKPREQDQKLAVVWCVHMHPTEFTGPCHTTGATRLFYLHHCYGWVAHTSISGIHNKQAVNTGSYMMYIALQHKQWVFTFTKWSCVLLVMGENEWVACPHEFDEWSGAWNYCHSSVHHIAQCLMPRSQLPAEALNLEDRCSVPSEQGCPCVTNMLSPVVVWEWVQYVSTPDECRTWWGKARAVVASTWLANKQCLRYQTTVISKYTCVQQCWASRFFVGHCSPCVYPLSTWCNQVTRSPRPSPSIFGYYKWSNTGGGKCYVKGYVCGTVVQPNCMHSGLIT